jgi:hypothetical protein
VIDKKLAVNVVLTFTYFLTSAVLVAPTRIGIGAGVAIVAGAVRATVGYYRKKTGSALLPDA